MGQELKTSLQVSAELDRKYNPEEFLIWLHLIWIFQKSIAIDLNVEFQEFFR